MERTRFIDHAGERILLLDYSGLTDPGEALREIEASRRFVAQQPDRSLLVLTDISGARYDSRVVQAMKKLAAHNKPYVIASSVVGMKPLQRIIFQMVVRFSGRNIQVLETREEAKDWLVGQKRSAT